MKNKHTGFALGLVIAIVAVVAAGWFYTTKIHKRPVVENSTAVSSTSPTENSDTNAEVSSTPNTTPPTPTQNPSSVPAFKTYTSATAGISFSYPSAWTIKEVSDGGHVIISGGPASKPTSFYLSTWGKIFNCPGKDCFVDVIAAASAFGISQGESVTVDGTTALKGKVAGLGTTYVIRVDDNGYTLSHDTDTATTSAMAQIITTLKFSK